MYQLLWLAQLGLVVLDMGHSIKCQATTTYYVPYSFGSGGQLSVCSLLALLYSLFNTVMHAHVLTVQLQGSSYCIVLSQTLTIATDCAYSQALQHALVCLTCMC